MSDSKSTYGFSLAEWETCLSVLDKLKNDPFNNPDNEHFKALISKIKKNARKQLRKESYQSKKEIDLAVQKKAVIVSNAISGESQYGISAADTLDGVEYSELKIPRNCYCCNQSFRLAHSFYSRICPQCASLNYEKRFQNADLTGQHALITGCRVKVGYATTLKLLRSGATVIGTTRFPALAMENFEKESDASEWIDRLVIYGLDLRDLKKIDDFIAFVKTKFDRLEILVNNAAQTIRYPDTYYLPLIDKEKNLLITANSDAVLENKTAVVSDQKLLETNVPHLSDLKLTRFGQPVDNRDKTSWNSKLEEVSLMELLEVNLINQIAPYHLIKELKNMMMNSIVENKHIINVTSSEGMFSYNNKTIYHPHTNMTKASLNMMTRTAATDFAKDRIYMNSVDVGWISTGAKEPLRKEQFDKAYVPPLDSVDGASRIMDPIYTIWEDTPIYGKLLKNYLVNEW